MAVRILGLNFSPRSGNNSGILLRHSLKGWARLTRARSSTKSSTCATSTSRPCRSCDICGQTKDGRFLDCVAAGEDDVQSVLDKMVAADGLLVATPVYFGLPSDLYSKFIMRTRVLRHQNFKLANRPVGVMAIAGRRSGGAETAIIATWLPFVRQGCLVVGNGDATCQFGAYGWAGGRGHILTDEWGLEQGVQTAERVYTWRR